MKIFCQSLLNSVKCDKSVKWLQQTGQKWLKDKTKVVSKMNRKTGSQIMNNLRTSMTDATFDY